MLHTISNPHLRRKPFLKHQPIFLNMTPMVDLFLLLTLFFMVTQTILTPKTLKIALPSKFKEENVFWGRCAPRTLNIILDENNKIYWYPGKLKPNDVRDILQVSDFSPNGIRKLLSAKNRHLAKHIKDLKLEYSSGQLQISKDSLSRLINALKKSDDTGPDVFIKATSKAKYSTIVDIIDEMNICNIAAYTIIEMNYLDEDALKRTKAKLAGASK